MTNPPDSPPRDVGYNSSKAIMSGVTWAVLMRFSMRFIGLFSTLILARLLTPDDFGVVALATLVAHFLFEMTEFGSSMLLIRSREIDRQRCDTAWTITLLQALVTAAVLAILAVPASLYFDEPRVIEVMYVLAASSFVAGFENIDADIHAALDAFSQQLPQLREIVIWGLCDAASAALFHAWRDPRVSGLVLLNPWARTEAGQARTYLRHYYLGRLISPDLWRKIWRGDFAFSAAWRSLRTMLGQARQPNANKAIVATSEQTPLPQRMTDGWQRFQGPILLILSGDDLTAAEFRDLARASRTWRRLLAQPRVTLHEYPEANHTFSCHEWRDQVATWTREWLGTW